MVSHLCFVFPQESLAWCCTDHGIDPLNTTVLFTKRSGWGWGQLHCSLSCLHSFLGHDDLVVLKRMTKRLNFIKQQNNVAKAHMNKFSYCMVVPVSNEWYTKYNASYVKMLEISAFLHLQFGHSGATITTEIWSYGKRLRTVCINWKDLLSFVLFLYLR